MSDANRSVLRYVKEVTPGTTPTNPAMQELTIKSAALKWTPQTVMDDQIRSDEQVQDNTLVGYDVAGDIQARLTPMALDDMIEAAMMSAWNNRPTFTPTAASATALTVASGGAALVANCLVWNSGFAVASNNGLKTVSASTGTSITASGLAVEATPPAGARTRLVGMSFVAADCVANVSKTLTVTAGDFTALGLVAGNWVNVGGTAVGDRFASAGNSGWCRVASATAKVLTFDVVPAGWATDTGTGKTIKIWVGDYLRNATSTVSYTFEREYNTDSGSQYWEYFRGCRLGKWGMKFAPRSNIDVTFEVMGLTASDVVNTRGADKSGGATIIGTPTTVAAPNSDLMNTSSNVGQFRLNNNVLAGANAVTDVSIDYDRTLRAREVVGQLAAADVRRGRAVFKLSATAYFQDTSMINLVRQSTATSLDFSLTDVDSIVGNTRGYYLDWPRIKASDGSINVEGVDTDITVPLQFQVIRHETLGYSFQMSRHWYLEF